MIEVDGVAVTLAGTRILDGVDATIGDGRFVGLVGPNGAGKTTLIRTIVGRLTPERGDVIVDGDPVSGLSARETSRRIATVPQETRLDFEFDVRTVVEMGRNPHRGRFSFRDPGWDRVADAMERTGITALADRSVTTLSGGERQRVLLARALAQAAPVLLLDEPTANLDINHQVATLELVRGLVDEGRTAIAAIHDLDLAARYCDELVLLHDGRVQATGPPADVLTTAGLESAFGARVAVSENPVTGSPSITALPDTRRSADGRVHVVCGGERGASILYPLVAAGFEVSVGPLQANDAATRPAELLGVEAAIGPPHSPFDEDLVRRAVDLVDEADVTVMADVAIGPSNLGALAVAEAADRLVVVDGRPIRERNHAGRTAASRYARLRDRGVVVPEEDLVATVEPLAACGTSRDTVSVELD